MTLLRFILTVLVRLLPKLTSIAVIEHMPAAHGFQSIEDETKLRAYAGGFTWVHDRKPFGLYFITYKNTFPINKGGRYNIIISPLLILFVLYLTI